MADRIENPSFHLENSLISLFVFSQISRFSFSLFMHSVVNPFKKQRISMVFP